MIDALGHAKPRLCAAIVDRLTFGGNIIETGTDSYRLEPPRRVRRAGSLEGSLSWHDPASTRPNCVSALSGL